MKDILLFLSSLTPFILLVNIVIIHYQNRKIEELRRKLSLCKLLLLSSADTRDLANKV